MIKAVIFDMDGVLVDSGQITSDGRFPLVQNAKKLVEALAESGQYLLGLSTSSHRSSAEAVLGREGVMKYLQASTCGNEVKFGKPDPEVFIRTIEKLGVEPGECVVIEDSANGMRGAKAAGALVIARKARHNERQDFSSADAVVEDLLDVLDILKSL